VDILFDQLPARFQAILKCLTTLVVLILFSLIAWQNVLYVRETYDQKLTSAILYIPLFPFVAAVALGFLALCLVLLVDFLNALIGVVSK
jgi:TRAP-type C4-dicarboxylate transport system permease small subunit